MSNRTTWRDARIVEEYAGATELQPPERALLEGLREKLPAMRMLDIGGGGGRTTLHFAPLARECTGIEYSEEMIAACRRRFAAGGGNPALAVCDARALARFADASFDFILFSFNGIDYVSHADRLQVLGEVARVGAAGGIFYFSSHNLQALVDYAAQSETNYRLLNDGVHDGRLATYYIKRPRVAQNREPWLYYASTIRCTSHLSDIAYLLDCQLGKL